MLFSIVSKGGEVKCNEISCYIRKDCEPKYMKGVCCPLYDNCPPLGTSPLHSSHNLVEIFEN